MSRTNAIDFNVISTAEDRVETLGKDAREVERRWQEKRRIALGWFCVLRLAELTRRLDAGQPVLRLIRDEAV